MDSSRSDSPDRPDPLDEITPEEWERAAASSRAYFDPVSRLRHLEAAFQETEDIELCLDGLHWLEEALDIYSPHVAARCAWLTGALRSCVERRLEQIPVNRTSNQLRQRENRLEDRARLTRVLELAGRVRYKGSEARRGYLPGQRERIPLNQAYELVAKERGVSAEAVKSSCYRELRRNADSVASMAPAGDD